MKNRPEALFLYIMALLYFTAGVNHFINPAFYKKIMPSYIPFHTACIIVSGICEIVFAVLLIPEVTRKIAAWLIIAMLTVFFVVHIQMLIDNSGEHGKLFWISLIRIPIQFVLMWWAYVYTKNPHQPG